MISLAHELFMRQHYPVTLIESFCLNEASTIIFSLKNMYILVRFFLSFPIFHTHVLSVALGA